MTIPVGTDPGGADGLSVGYTVHAGERCVCVCGGGAQCVCYRLGMSLFKSPDRVENVYVNVCVFMNTVCFYEYTVCFSEHYVLCMCACVIRREDEEGAFIREVAS